MSCQQRTRFRGQDIRVPCGSGSGEPQGFAAEDVVVKPYELSKAIALGKSGG